MKRFLCSLAALAVCAGAMAQSESPVEESAAVQQSNGEIGKYRRSSLYTVLIKHPTFKYGEAIDSAFMSMPTPDKFNNHDLPVKSLVSSATVQKKKGKYKQSINEADINTFIESNDVAKGLVSKWFCRDSESGAFDMELIRQRGNYDAAQADIQIADRSALGRAILADAGEDLIGKTFMLVSDITFVDKGERSAQWGGVLRQLGQATAAATNNSSFSTLGDATALAVNEIDGFSVAVTSYLYRLEWTEDTAGCFYTQYWMDEQSPDADRRMAYDTCRLFKLCCMGSTQTSAANMTSKSFAKASKESQMLKVCTRAIDKAIVQLQRDFDEFKVNTPLYKINEDGTVDVQIGLKEGVNTRSQFDVLMPVEDENGRMQYEKVGRIEPIEGRIWDNRFGADEDMAAREADKDAKSNDSDDGVGDPSLTASTFRVISGSSKIVPGCLVREVTIKRAE